MANQKVEHKCKRCGKCCQCGTMWVNSDHPIIRRIFKALPIDYFTDDGQCAMLKVADDGKATCLIELHLGKEYKPDVCNEYPNESEDGVCMGMH